MLIQQFEVKFYGENKKKVQEYVLFTYIQICQTHFILIVHSLYFNFFFTLHQLQTLTVNKMTIVNTIYMDSIYDIAHP